LSFFLKTIIFIIKTKKMGRKIRLTESEFHSLVRRLVKEAQVEMNNPEMEEGFVGDMISNMGAKFGKAVEMAKQEAMKFFSQLSPTQLSTVKMKIQDLDLAPVAEKVQQMEDEESEESGLNESFFLNEGVMDRVNRFMSRFGLGLSGTLGITGFMAFLSQIPGWIDFDFLTKIHEISEMAGLGRGTGPIGFLIFALGVVGAIWSLAARDSEQRS